MVFGKKSRATDPRKLDELDEALRKVKGPLRTCRAKHGVAGDVTFKLRYEADGSVTAVTVDAPNISPAFIADTVIIIKGMVTLPPSARGGSLDFTDLGDASTPYR